MAQESVNTYFHCGPEIPWHSPRRSESDFTSIDRVRVIIILIYSASVPITNVVIDSFYTAYLFHNITPVDLCIVAIGSLQC